MLHKSHITNIEVYSEEWHKHRIGKFTSSRISCLCGDDGIGKGAMTYIYQKVGETITGIPNDKEFVDFDEDLEWGKKYEDEAIRAFGRKMGVQFLVTQKLISDPGNQFASTPDALWVHGECILDSNEYNVSTAEGKCPRTYHNFLPMYLCDTPADVYKLKKDYFWQTIDQMHQCGAAIGYFFVYHPFFPEGSNLKIIQFRKMELWEYFKKLADRKKQAIQKFEEIRLKMLGFQTQSN